MSQGLEFMIVLVLQAMGMMNKQLNMPALQKIMREFERQNEKMEMTSEMMGDAIDDAFEVNLSSLLFSPFEAPNQLKYFYVTQDQFLLNPCQEPARQS